MESKTTDLHFSAAIFDLDGVVTHTASLHAKAWKQAFDEYLKTWSESQAVEFVPFDIRGDYLQYVDGKPRYQGVQSFLESRGIQIPFGTPQDDPSANTCCGVGNRKNELYNSLVDKEGVDVFDTTVSLINELRGRGVRVGLMSSSKNTEHILRRTGLLDLFEARVDGVVSERIGLRGKPHPDAFVKTAEILGILPHKAIVFEDAVSGVQAGHHGGFGLVIGVDREGHPAALLEAGADYVVQDLGELTVDGIEQLFLRSQSQLPSALERWSEVSELLENRKIVVFLDYDGTLTPIVERPDLATMSAPMRDALAALSRIYPTVIVSGRGREDVSEMVGLDSIYYAGSHGFDIAGPVGTSLRYEVGAQYRSALAEAAKSIGSRLADVGGVMIEDKKFSVAVHFRLAADDDIPQIEAAVDDVVAAHEPLMKTHGKRIFELRPRIEWNKGKAVLWLLEALGLDSPDTLPLYIGDDITDEDAFIALKDGGLGVIVADEPRDTHASMYLRNTDEVGQFLELLMELQT
ncbi:MAG: trehalose-phosphatase [Gemmatimonadota bacterium]|nr:MAG: trehalose-phosphatase [Gemmatimonadota bacterium]